MKTIYGIQQKTEGLRKAAYLLHCSLIEKKNRVDITDYWPLPFDEDPNIRMAARKQEYELLREQIFTNGN
jgi:hypothetical protein